MQAALVFTPSSIPLVPVTPPKPLAASPLRSISTHLKITHTTCTPIRATTAAHDASTVDYSSMTSSVFPAEACETIGGEACDVEMYPESKPKSAATPTTKTAASESVDREYLAYNEPKTVFLGEACDDLGGEFCEAEYQTGVY